MSADPLGAGEIGILRILRVLLVDDHRPFRLALRSLLEAEGGYTVVGEAVDGEQAHQQAVTLRPDLILMDVRLPGINGIDATRRILAAFPSAAVILMSTRRPAELPADLQDCGALGFVPKEALDPLVLREMITNPPSS